MAQVDVDLAFYRRSNPDLRLLSDDELSVHYHAFGISEGRVGSALACREGLIEKLVGERNILEIGPFLRPVVSGDHVKYFDVLDRQGLRERALAIGYAETAAPDIHYVSPVGDLSVVGDSFSAIVSSHCIEHQPDLVRHLQDVGTILDHRGRYYLMIPDKRYCFDHLIGESTIADVLDAHVSKRRHHTVRSVVEHRALTTHNDPSRHWRGDHVDAGFDRTIIPRARAALAEFEAMNGAYIDVHAWQFTPGSFRRIIDQLCGLGLSPVAVEAVFETPFGRNEFTAILAKRVI